MRRIKHIKVIFLLTVFISLCWPSFANPFASSFMYQNDFVEENTPWSTTTTEEEGPKRIYAEFSIVNDTESDYYYFVAGSVETIKKGNTRTFSCPEGIDIFHLEKETKGKLWFTVSPVFNKRVFKLSEITKSDLFSLKD